MDARELRIGNIIQKKQGNSHHMSPYAVTVNFILNFTKYPEHFSKYSAPIPLTEDWLTKFGFIGRMKNGLCLGSNFDVNFYDNTGAKVKTIYIKYVHELQNTYKVLTGQELELHEPSNLNL